MDKLHCLEFDNLVVTESSNLYLLKKIQGHKICENTTILVEDIEFDVDYILKDERENHYRLINSNDTLIVELK